MSNFIMFAPRITLVDSMAASVTPSSASQAAIFCSARQNVLNVLNHLPVLTSQLAWQPNRDRDLVLVHIDPRHTGMNNIHPVSLAHPPAMDTGTPPAEPATRSRSCQTRS